MKKRDTILIVDDMDVNRAILCEIFKDDYRILEADNGRKALEIIENEKDCLATILLDIVMPEMNGFEVLENIDHAVMKEVPVILITGDTTTMPEERGFDLGVADVVKKPFEPHVVRRRVANVINLWNHTNNLEELVKEQTARLRETNSKIIDTLSTVVEFRDLESGEHINRIKGFTRILLNYVMQYYKEYGITEDQREKIVQASVMHDVGKIAIPDHILLKPGKLTDEEFEIMKQHTVKGCDIIDTISFIDDKEFFRYCYEICRHHHERYDGRGYPDRLEGENIPISAQIVSLADVYDALVSERVYKKAFSPDQAYTMIQEGQCGTFSPKILDCFRMAKGEFEELKMSLK